MAHLTLIRHGETDSNRVHRFQGQMDVPLNATGLLQAERLGERLAGEYFDVGVVSDLSRARATAAPIAQRLNLAMPPDAGWREQAFGVFEGLKVGDILDQHPDLWQQWVRHDADFTLPGGESVRAFHARVWSALDALAARHVGQRVLVVTHGGVLDMVWRTVRGQSLSSARECAIPNAGVNRLQWRGPGRVEIEVWGDDTHLAGLPAQPSTVSLSVRYGAVTTP
ncbi:histidine phosphatase family protein [Sphaerotilus sp.]|jgi:2,3-bisphosphoglycerate-dependent phosphoglycerate mutase|uniref:histidine phosphatase family protein n=1 Tax=Sphaerotilus sp. TaxID=2093942 RepID=UPI0025E4BB0D|nr:histidine phosphatase family protein [Sphaerotilus sp.]